MQPLVPHLWINDGKVDEVVDFYVSLLDDSRVVARMPYGPEAGEWAGQTMAVTFELVGHTYVAINGADTRFEPNEAISLAVPCDTQEEIDRLWSGLTDGGKGGPCGWLQDRYGFSWQVYPASLDEHLASDDPERARRAVAYFMTLDGVPFVLDDLEAAVRGEG